VKERRKEMKRKPGAIIRWKKPGAITRWTEEACEENANSEADVLL